LRRLRCPQLGECIGVEPRAAVAGEDDTIAAMDGRPDRDPRCLEGGSASDVARRRRVDRVLVSIGARQHMLVQQQLLLLLLAEAGLRG